VIQREHVEKFKRLAVVGIVSSRGDTHQIAESLGLKVSGIGKENALRQIAEMYPEETTKIYVADLKGDEDAAKNAGWDFMYPHEFLEWLKDVV
jgi:hypothetical protein